MSRIWISLGVIVCLVGLAVPAAALELGVRGYYWFPDLVADVKYDTSDVDGTDIDMVDDLGLEAESYPMIEVFAGLGSHHFSFTYYKAEYSGTDTPNEDLVFGDATFPLDNEVDTTLEYTVMDFAYQWDVIDLENFLAGASLGIVGKVKYFDVVTTLEEDSIDAELAVGAPLPMIGLNLHMGILADIIEARLQVAGIGYDGNSVIEYFGDISYTPFPFLDIHAGYRSFTVTIDIDDVEANFGTSGPYAAITLSF
jgi:hypothetical protein